MIMNPFANNFHGVSYSTLLISTAMRGVTAMALLTAALAATLAIVAARVGGAGSRQAALAAASRGYGAAAQLPNTCGLLDGEPGQSLLHASSSYAEVTDGLTRVGVGSFGEVRRSLVSRWTRGKSALCHRFSPRYPPFRCSGGLLTSTTKASRSLLTSL